MILYRRLLRYVRPYRGVFAVAVVGMLLVASTDVLDIDPIAAARAKIVKNAAKYPPPL